MKPAWIDEFLPLLCCPDTRQPLHWATAEELQAHGLEASACALVREDGRRIFPIDNGIPILLPETG